MDIRLEQATRWLKETVKLPHFEVKPLSGDASFRRYFRVTTTSERYALMDAPPSHEDCVPFVAIAESWLQQDIPVPRVIAKDISEGFLLLEDFGDLLFSDALKEGDADTLYHRAIQHLVRIQTSQPPQEYELPPYDHALLEREIGLFPEWLLQRKLGVPISSSTQAALDSFYQTLIRSALNQPQVVVHRDYHSRNLMVQEDGSLGIIDFQDAVMGPVSYDLVSLLRDCYIEWPVEQVDKWKEIYHRELAKTSLSGTVSPVQFERDFDLMGMQRHLKAAGIFARLALRDDKQGYLKDIPRTVGYITRISGKYAEFETVHHWLKTELTPRLQPLLEEDTA